jgi:hypothetical protein
MVGSMDPEFMYMIMKLEVEFSPTLGALQYLYQRIWQLTVAASFTFCRITSK